MFALRSRSHPQKEAVARRHRGSYHLPAHYPTRVRGGRSITTEELHAADPSPADAVVKGRRAVSADTALLLDALTGWDAQIWLTLQAKWDLWHALKARGRRPKVRPLRKTA